MAAYTRQKPTSFLSCAETGVPLIVVGKVSEFDKGFRALRKAHRSVDPSASGTVKTVNRWSHAAQAYVTEEIVVDTTPSPAAAAMATPAAAAGGGSVDGDDDDEGSSSSSSSSGGGSGGGSSVFGCASRLMGFANTATAIDHPLCPKAFDARNRALAEEAAAAQEAVAAYGVLLKLLQLQDGGARVPDMETTGDEAAAAAAAAAAGGQQQQLQQQQQQEEEWEEPADVAREVEQLETELARLRSAREAERRRRAAAAAGDARLRGARGRCWQLLHASQLCHASLARESSSVAMRRTSARDCYCCYYCYYYGLVRVSRSSTDSPHLATPLLLYLFVCVHRHFSTCCSWSTVMQVRGCSLTCTTSPPAPSTTTPSTSGTAARSRRSTASGWAGCPPPTPSPGRR